MIFVNDFCQVCLWDPVILVPNFRSYLWLVYYILSKVRQMGIVVVDETVGENFTKHQFCNIIFLIFLVIGLLKGRADIELAIYHQNIGMLLSLKHIGLRDSKLN
jgi:hypothetical protein